MIHVLMVWDDCALRNGEWTAESSTAYWLRVPRDEVDDVVRYASDPQGQAESVAEEQSGGDDAYFLVSDDLMSIVNMPEYYPISGQWNGEGPFRELAQPIEIAKLQDLTSLDV